MLVRISALSLLFLFLRLLLLGVYLLLSTLRSSSSPLSDCPTSSSLLPLGFAVAPVAPVSFAPLLPPFSLGSASLVAPSLPFAAQSLPYFFLCLLVLWCFGSLFRCFSSSSEPAPPPRVPLLPLPRLASSFSFCFWPFLAPSPPGPAVPVVTSLLPIWPFLLCLTLFMLRSVACLCTLFAVSVWLLLLLLIFLAWLGFPRVRTSLSHADNRLVSLLASGCPASSTLIIVCLDALFMGISLLLLLFLSSFLPSFHVCVLAIVFLGCASGVAF